jgi:hypothetical protein
MTSRTNDPDTSVEAAAMIEPHVSHIQLCILQALRRRPLGLSTRELAHILSIDFATVSPRMRPMANDDWVVMAPRKVKNPIGKGWGRVWVITAKGLGIIA